MLWWWCDVTLDGSESQSATLIYILLHCICPFSVKSQSLFLLDHFSNSLHSSLLPLTLLVPSPSLLPLYGFFGWFAAVTRLLYHAPYIHFCSWKKEGREREKPCKRKRKGMKGSQWDTLRTSSLCVNQYSEIGRHVEIGLGHLVPPSTTYINTHTHKHTYTHTHLYPMHGLWTVSHNRRSALLLVWCHEQHRSPHDDLHSPNITCTR
jgi:hypothetical protein